MLTGSHPYMLRHFKAELKEEEEGSSTDQGEDTQEHHNPSALYTLRHARVGTSDETVLSFHSPLFHFVIPPEPSMTQHDPYDPNVKL